MSRRVAQTAWSCDQSRRVATAPVQGGFLSRIRFLHDRKKLLTALFRRFRLNARPAHPRLRNRMRYAQGVARRRNRSQLIRDEAASDSSQLQAFAGFCGQVADAPDGQRTWAASVRVSTATSTSSVRAANCGTCECSTPFRVAPWISSFLFSLDPDNENRGLAMK